MVVIRGSWFVIREGGGLTAAEYIWGLWLPIVPAEFFLICAGRPLSHFVTAPLARGAFSRTDRGNCPGIFRQSAHHLLHIFWPLTINPNAQFSSVTVSFWTKAAR